MNLVDKLAEEIEKERKRIVVVGDAMIDEWIHGETYDCQDGCPKFVANDILRRKTPGGAANAARCLKNWDVVIDLYSQSPTNFPIKTRYIDQNNRIVFRQDIEWSIPYSDNHNVILKALRGASGVLLSDYDKGFLSQEFILDVADLCISLGIPCVADVKRERHIYAGCILKANADWCVKHASGSWESVDVVTSGMHRPLVYGKKVGVKRTVRCVNHVGAGDCFAAHLTLALACKFSLEDAATVAHSAGRVYVQHLHNRPPFPREIESDLYLYVV